MPTAFVALVEKNTGCFFTFYVKNWQLVNTSDAALKYRFFVIGTEIESLMKRNTKCYGTEKVNTFKGCSLKDAKGKAGPSDLHRYLYLLYLLLTSLPNSSHFELAAIFTQQNIPMF